MIAAVSLTADALGGKSDAGDSEPAYEVAGGEKFETVDGRVRQAHKDAPWLDRITYVGPTRNFSPFGALDLQIDTDLDEESAADTATAIEICNAYLAATSAPLEVGVVVNGKLFDTRTNVDGTKRDATVDSKMASSLFNTPENPDCVTA